MVKIKELSDNELLKKTNEYKKIVSQLERECEKRGIIKAQSKPIIKTPAPTPASNPVEADSEHFQLKFDDDEILKIDKAAAIAKDSKEQGDEEDIRVTQLLKLSKKDLEELQKAKNKK